MQSLNTPDVKLGDLWSQGLFGEAKVFLEILQGVGPLDGLPPPLARHKVILADSVQ